MMETKMVVKMSEKTLMTTMMDSLTRLTIAQSMQEQVILEH